MDMKTTPLAALNDASLLKTHALINGEWLPGAARFDVHDPATGLKLADVANLGAAETKADTEFLARELAAVRLAVGDTVTRDYLRKELDDLIDELAQRLRQPQGGTADGAAGTGSAAPRQPDA